MSTVTMLVHNRVQLALHHLRPASAAGGRPLLLLHGLGEASPTSVPSILGAIRRTFTMGPFPNCCSSLARPTRNHPRPPGNDGHDQQPLDDGPATNQTKGQPEMR